MDAGSKRPATSSTMHAASKSPAACSSAIGQLIGAASSASVDRVRHVCKRKASPELIGTDLLESKRARASEDVFQKMVKDLEYHHRFEGNDLAPKIVMRMEQAPLEKASSMDSYHCDLIRNSDLCYQPLANGEYGANNMVAFNGLEKNAGFEDDRSRNVLPSSDGNAGLGKNSDIHGLEKTTARSQVLSNMNNHKAPFLGVSSGTGQSDLGSEKSAEIEMLSSTVYQTTSNGKQVSSSVKASTSRSRPNLKRKATSMGGERSTDRSCKRRGTSIGAVNNNPEITKGQWTEEQSQLLCRMLYQYEEKMQDAKEKWMEIVNALPGKIAKQHCQEIINNHLNPVAKGRVGSAGPAYNNQESSEGQWTEEESQLLCRMVNQHDEKLQDAEKEWMEIAKQCKEKLNNDLNPDVKGRVGSAGPAYNNQEVIRRHWTDEESQLLCRMVNEHGKKEEGKEKWMEIATGLLGRTAKQCEERWNSHVHHQNKIRVGAAGPGCTNNQEMIKGQWTEEENQLLRKMVNEYEKKQEEGKEKWMVIANVLPGRTAKQCKERWNNHLNPTVKKEGFTLAEEKLLIAAHKELGHKWAEISRTKMPGRAENTIKNRWNAAYRKIFERLKPPASLLEQYIKDLGPRPKVRRSASKTSKKTPPADTYVDCQNSPTLLTDTSNNGNTVPPFETQPTSETTQTGSFCFIPVQIDDYLQQLPTSSQSELLVQEKETYAVENQLPEPAPDIENPWTCVHLTNNYISKDTPPSLPSTSPRGTCSAVTIQELPQTCVDLTDDYSTELFEDLESLLEVHPPPSLPLTYAVANQLPKSAPDIKIPWTNKDTPPSLPSKSSRGTCFAVALQELPQANELRKTCVDLTDNYSSELFEDLESLLEVQHLPPSLPLTYRRDTFCDISDQSAESFCTDPLQLEDYLQPNSMPATSNQSELVWRSYVDEWFQKDSNDCFTLENQMPEAAPDIEKPPTCMGDYSSCVDLTDNLSNEDVEFSEEINRFYEVHHPSLLVSKSPVQTSCCAIPISSSASSSQPELIARSCTGDWLRTDDNDYSALPGMIKDQSLPMSAPAPAQETHSTYFDPGNEEYMDALTKYLNGNNLSLDDMNEEELQKLAMCFEV